MKFKDSRVKAVNEMLSGMKVNRIKFQCDII